MIPILAHLKASLFFVIQPAGHKTVLILNALISFVEILVKEDPSLNSRNIVARDKCQIFTSILLLIIMVGEN